MQGDLKDMALADLIQYACMSGKTALLKVTHADRQANIYFDEGNIVHAYFEGLEGEEVIYKILHWETGVFDLETGVKPEKITINRTWSILLLEGARIIDEQKSEEKRSEEYLSLKKDVEMNIKRMNKITEDLREDLGNALIGTDIWKTDDAESLAGYNSNPKAAALFNEITRMLDKTLKGSEFPGLGKYYMVNLENNMMVVVVKQGDFQNGILVDLSKTTIGLLINVALPKVMTGLAEAVR